MKPQPIYRSCPHCNAAIPEQFYSRHQQSHTKPENPSNDVQYFSQHYQALAYSQRSKADKFIANRCIEYTSLGTYVCKPLKGYNVRTYIMKRDSQGRWTCDCQAFNRYKDDPDYMCSHLGSLFQFFKMRQIYPSVIE